MCTSQLSSHTNNGNFEYTVLCFESYISGLTNAASIFQALLKRVLAEHLGDLGIMSYALYMDDIFIFSETLYSICVLYCSP